jgi:hypothetical protein
VKKKIKLLLLDALASILLGWGIVFVVSPVWLIWFIHGDYERYLWIINGPFPFSQFGSGPFQLFMFIFLVLSGILMISVGIILRWYLPSNDNKN